jgi:branched-chain amino acid transport system ATP-binding protein
VLLTVEDLTVRYGRIPAVKEVSLHVGEGELVGLVGPNGAGKSTTLHAIMGLAGSFSGSITFDGQSLIGRSTEDIARAGVALVPEGRHILATLSVAENLDAGMTASSSRAAARHRLDGVLDRFPILRTYYRSAAGKLSGGEQQMLAIARALVAGPRLLLLDEPSLGLAPLVVDRVFELLDELRQEGSTILLVEQNASRTIQVADRSYILRAGEIVLSGTGRELAREVDLATAYLGI